MTRPSSMPLRPTPQASISELRIRLRVGRAVSLSGLTWRVDHDLGAGAVLDARDRLAQGHDRRRPPAHPRSRRRGRRRSGRARAGRAPAPGRCRARCPGSNVAAGVGCGAGVAPGSGVTTGTGVAPGGGRDDGPGVADARGERHDALGDRGQPLAVGERRIDRVGHDRVEGGLADARVAAPHPPAIAAIAFCFWRSRSIISTAPSPSAPPTPHASSSAWASAADLVARSARQA